MCLKPQGAGSGLKTFRVQGLGFRVTLSRFRVTLSLSLVLKIVGPFCLRLLYGTKDLGVPKGDPNFGNYPYGSVPFMFHIISFPFDSPSLFG